MTSLIIASAPSWPDPESHLLFLRQYDEVISVLVNYLFSKSADRYISMCLLLFGFAPAQGLSCGKPVLGVVLSGLP